VGGSAGGHSAVPRDDEADAEALAGAARERLSAFKVPTLRLVVPDPDAVPMSATGKVDKRALQELLRARGVRARARAAF
jgi:acyl-CoA synthetase (AMP-forming)/AMP-acid ligase II